MVSPCVLVEAVGGTFAAAGADIDECVNGDVWMSSVRYRNGLNPVWMERLEVAL